MSAPFDDLQSDRILHLLNRYGEHQAHVLGTLEHVGPPTSRNATRVAARRTPSIFDDLIASITGTSTTVVEATAAPPRSRFMVRVAEVGRPHRRTRRNYDYFEALDARLADQRAEEAASGTG